MPRGSRSPTDSPRTGRRIGHVVCHWHLCAELIPVRVGEGNVVESCPLGKDPFLSDEPVMVAPVAPLVVNVGEAFVRALWLVIVIRHLPGQRILTTAVREGGSERQRVKRPEAAMFKLMKE